MPLGHGDFGFWRRRQLGRTLREESYEQAIVLPNSWKSALVPAFARIPRRTGWRGEFRHGLLNALRYLDEAALPLMLQRFLALGVDPADPVPSFQDQGFETRMGQVSSTGQAVVASTDNNDVVFVGHNLLIPSNEYHSRQMCYSEYLSNNSL